MINEREAPRTERKLIELGQAGSTAKFADHARQLERELIEANEIVDAARNLCKVKGRFHTEQAMSRLMIACCYAILNQGSDDETES